MVDLERPVAAAGGRFDGHVVQGHVDGTGVIASIEQPDVIERILERLRDTVEPVDPAHPSRAPPQGDRLV